MSKYALAYDEPNGRQCLVFAEFDRKPSPKECLDAIERQSDVLGFLLKIKDLWYIGPVWD